LAAAACGTVCCVLLCMWCLAFACGGWGSFGCFSKPAPSMHTPPPCTEWWHCLSVARCSDNHGWLYVSQPRACLWGHHDQAGQQGAGMMSYRHNLALL
jgi:hypothetical protein